MRIIDLATWQHAERYRFFRGYTTPHYAITADLDVTHLVSELKPKGVSVFNACAFALTHGANAVPELRTRFRGDVVVEHDRIGTSFTVPLGEERFAFCQVDFVPDWPVFNAACSAAVERARSGETFSDTTGDDDQWIYMTCLPWLSFSAMTHPVKGPDDCVPRVGWGRYSDNGRGGITVPVATQVHHALVDGLHLSKFYAAAQDTLDGLSAQVMNS